jgi:transcriptional regulator with XRE-family HTH domain
LNHKQTAIPANKMKEFRQALGLSQEEAAASSLIERTRFQRIENQKVKPSKEEMEFISEALASSVEECFPNTEEGSTGEKGGAASREAQVS